MLGKNYVEVCTIYGLITDASLFIFNDGYYYMEHCINSLKRKLIVLGSGGTYDAAEDRQVDRIREELRQQGVSRTLLSTFISFGFCSFHENSCYINLLKKMRILLRYKVLLHITVIKLNNNNHTYCNYINFTDITVIMNPVLKILIERFSV